MGIPVSLLLIAVGAILAFAVTNDAEGIDIQVVGVILMIIGAIGFLLTMLFWQSWWGGRYLRRTAYVDEGAQPVYRTRARRTVVEEEEPPAAEPPPGPPY
jgi:hypothetical protein